MGRGKPVTHTKERATRTAFQALVFGSPPEKVRMGSWVRGASAVLFVGYKEGGYGYLRKHWSERAGGR